MTKFYEHKPYTKDIIFARNDFYIHKHHTCIGHAWGGSATSEDVLFNIFTYQKTTASSAAKKQYLDLFYQNLKIGKTEQSLLEGAFQSREKMAEAIDKQVKKSLQLGIRPDLVKSLFAKQKQAMSIAPKILDSDAQVAFRAFGELMELLASTAALIEGGQGAALAQAIRVCQQNYSFATNIGTSLSTAIDQFMSQHKIQKTSKTRIAQVCNALKNLGERLATGRIASGKKEITPENIGKVVEKVFNPAFAEAIISQINAVGQLAFMDSAIKLQGLDRTKIQFTDQFGNVVTKSSVRNQKAQGKVDFKVKGATFAFESTNPSINGVEMRMNIGISNKFYVTNGFSWDSSLNPSGGSSYSGGSGGSLKEAIESLFNSKYIQYLAYNTIAHEKDLPRANASLNDVILTRQINRIFATRGGKDDFAQYLLVNGEVVSILDIINHLTTHRSLLSNSQMGSEDQAVSLTLKNRPAILDAMANGQDDTRLRVFSVNKAIRGAKVSAFVHVNKLTAALRNS